MEEFGAGMKYTVIWRPSAERFLAELWTDGPDRQAVTDAANEIDSILEKNPALAGQARSGNLRFLVEPPLAIYYTVSETDCLVTVWDVWRCPSST